ncbi:MAG TPA: peptide-methionine (S)-S-oxide reductase MsrA [Verrucomicrobiae bacterium]|jgi:peptide-methionine (S)-S-oxide reductase|nr:peptide-methionine (S)-S-oxide reductase MsrA [Verrucomicrobiae bacterium]
MKHFCTALMLFTLLAAGCSAGDSPGTNANDKVTFFTVPKVPDGAEVITLGAGCFWCTEAIFQQVPGVISVTSGYSGGTVKNPTYDLVCTGLTGHAEVSRIVFDPKKTSLEKILAVFWEAHDPTSLNRQGNDSGTQYRSAIFYYTDEQRQIAEKSRAEAAKEFSRPVVTEITKAGEFYPAEDYHQNYYQLNKNINPYCTMVISPKLKKLGLKE